MGTDIHVFMERRYQGRWVPVHPPEVKDPEDWDELGRYAEPLSPMEQLAHEAMPLEERIPSLAAEWWVSRDYTLFTNLAGVRNYGDALVFAEDIGAPDDMSEAVEEQLEHYHTPSYWVLQDLEHENVSARHGGVSKRVQTLIDAMRDIAKAYNLNHTEVRMVFGFDS